MIGKYPRAEVFKALTELGVNITVAKHHCSKEEIFNRAEVSPVKIKKSKQCFCNDHISEGTLAYAYIEIEDEKALIKNDLGHDSIIFKLNIITTNFNKVVCRCVLDTDLQMIIVDNSYHLKDFVEAIENMDVVAHMMNYFVNKNEYDNKKFRFDEKTSKIAKITVATSLLFMVGAIISIVCIISKGVFVKDIAQAFVICIGMSIITYIASSIISDKKYEKTKKGKNDFYFCNKLKEVINRDEAEKIEKS